MPCLVGCLALAFPRLAVVLVWLLGGSYLSRAYEHWVWPVLGFFFLPLTTLTFAFAMNSMGDPGSVSPLGWLLIALSAALDLGLVGQGHSGYRKRERQKRDDR
ncbi:MAG: hypothetical protein SFV15_23305 [Polyangiaceae bacterium]|nr:hypothetical protein [Polyangiaceae bacterium]